jgi:hypothetical protein
MHTLVAALLTAVSTFIFTGLLGNYLAQMWQQRNWLNQHRLRGAEKRFEELQKLVDEITTLGDARSFRARRIIRYRPGNIVDLAELRETHDQAVVQWNERFTTIKVKLTMYAGYTRFTEVLEDDIQPAFIAIGDQLDIVMKYLDAGVLIPSNIRNQAETMLNDLSGKLFRFSRDLLRLLITKKQEAYEGERIPFSEATLELFSRWYLIKALFKTEHPAEPVGSPALNVAAPFFYRSDRSGID